MRTAWLVVLLALAACGSSAPHLPRDTPTRLSDADPTRWQGINPASLPGTRNDKPTGLFYTGTRWAIYNLDSTAMPVGAAYNVLVVNP